MANQNKIEFLEDLSSKSLSILDSRNSLFDLLKTPTYISQLSQNEIVESYLLILDASLSDLEKTRLFIKKLCDDIRGDSKKIIYHLELVINEIFCNIVEHGYDSNPKGLVVIKGSKIDDGISLDFFDQGRSYTFNQNSETTVESRNDRGFGLLIVRGSVDRIIYNAKLSNDDWNHLHLFKKFIENEG
jgi:anti-sigma regulatory factor (Ser/Thr protein kinase)